MTVRLFVTIKRLIMWTRLMQFRTFNTIRKPVRFWMKSRRQMSQNRMQMPRPHSLNKNTLLLVKHRSKMHAKGVETPPQRFFDTKGDNMLEMIINDVTNWHRETFPDAEKESQVKKLEEELNEYYEKYDDLELADVLICSIALWRRFKCPIGHAVFVYASSIISGDKANRIVAQKMKINRARNWKKIDGVYRHVESGER